MKRQIWTTFCPSKISWELGKIDSKGKSATSDWSKNITLIKESLLLLKKNGISGIRLVIFPQELTRDGENFNWKPLDTMLTLCNRLKLEVDLCIGPYQYPYYPGIYIPKVFLRNLKNIQYIDEDLSILIYGKDFLKQQVKRYGANKRIHGFHLGNEWPNRQGIEGIAQKQFKISEKFMLEAAEYLRKSTKKPISLNTNIDIIFKRALEKEYGNILKILGNKGKLGFDIYPSRETWRLAPIQKLYRFFESYFKSLNKVETSFKKCEIYFAEVEAQPWGNGRSWYEIIRKEQEPHTKVLGFTSDSLINTWKNHIELSHCTVISLWGSDFWLSAYRMEVRWPLEQIKRLQMKNP